MLFLGGYSVNGGSGENTYGRKSLGQELRVNNVTSPEFTSIQHGSRALAIKDMRKSQGKIGQTGGGGCSHKCLHKHLYPFCFLDAVLLTNAFAYMSWFVYFWVEKRVPMIIVCILSPVNCFLDQILTGKVLILFLSILSREFS